MSSSPHSKSSLSALKVPELKALCTKNGLPVSGNKGDLIARLMAHFEIPESRSATVTPRKDAASTPATSTAAPAPKPDLTAPAAATEPASAPTQPPPAPAPVSVAEPDAPSAPTVPATPASKPSSTHPPPSAIEAEMEKRRLRAERFGIVNGSSAAATEATPAASTDEELRKLERAKRFGITADAEQKIQALDQPLGDGKRSEAGTGAPKSVADMEWEARKRKRAEKFGLVDNPSLKDDGLRRKHPRSSGY